MRPYCIDISVMQEKLVMHLPYETERLQIIVRQLIREYIYDLGLIWDK